jgi:hypothetical protein
MNGIQKDGVATCVRAWPAADLKALVHQRLSVAVPVLESSLKSDSARGSALAATPANFANQKETAQE